MHPDRLDISQQSPDDRILDLLASCDRIRCILELGHRQRGDIIHCRLPIVPFNEECVAHRRFPELDNIIQQVHEGFVACKSTRISRGKHQSNYF